MGNFKHMARSAFHFLIIGLTLAAFLYSGAVTHASLIEDLKEKISGRADEIKKLEEEIAGYVRQVEDAGKTAETLKSALKVLDLTDKKLGTDIRVTEKKTTAAALLIEKLGIEIAEKEKKIGQNSTVLREAIREVNELESRTFVEIVLSRFSLGAFWKSIEGLERFQASVRAHVKEIQSARDELETKKDESLAEKKKLLALSFQLIDQKDIVKENKNTKNQLLAETRNKESEYKTLLEDRLEKKEALEREIQEFEAQLQVEIDPTSLPETGTGILRWPLDSPIITQYFGNTSFATANSQIYNGKGHNGIDLRASVGTAIKAAARGIIAGVGDTDRECYGVSYGKWVLVRHDNGLSTLYAHLSLIRGEAGQSIERGDVLGYSGRTGYSTGPHLHFAIFATQAVSISERYRSKICGTFLTLPLSSQNGYLNPLSYLPKVQP